MTQKSSSESSSASTTASSSQRSPAEYNPAALEPKWQRYWEQNKTFKTPAAPGAKKAYVLDMFPYPSGSGIHIGHPLGYSGSDIYSRYKHMNGYSVLHPMGYDAFGLPAEQHAMNTGEHPGIITNQSCDHFTKQLKRIGFCYDWDREVRTCSVEYYKWTQWIFLKLYNSWFDHDQQKARPIEELPIPAEVKSKGPLAIQEYQSDRRLAFMAEAMVNWCPGLGTVLANEEVIDGRSERGSHEVFRKPMRQWMLRITAYAERLLSELETLQWPEAIKEQQRHWIGKKNGTEIDFSVATPSGSEKKLRAFTTRSDTLFGVTFVVISPEHALVDQITTAERKKAVEEYRVAASRMSDLDRTLETRKKTGCDTGARAKNPITGELVPVFVADYVLMGFGTGAVMGVPAHDERDFEFAALFNLPVKPVIIPPESAGDAVAQTLAGKQAWTEAGTMISLDWPIAKELALAGKSNDDARTVINNWLTKQGVGTVVVNYRLRDWVFSRQRYWGEPIPIIHWEDGSVTSLSEQELPLELPQVQDFKPSESGESPLAKAGDWLSVTDPKTGKRGRRETNTMPQWAGSCWYYLRFIDPKNANEPWDAKLEKSWMNVDLYVGGAEHAVLHLLYSRFWHKVLFDLGYVSTREPFQRLFNQGMIQAYAYKDPRGVLVPTDQVDFDGSGNATRKGDGAKLERIVAKMSKSLRNVVSPDTVIEEYGADTLRMYLMFRGPLDGSGPWDPKAISGVFRFLRRAWSFVTGDKESGFADVVAEGSEERSVTQAIHACVKKVGNDLDTLQFNTAISALMECLNAVASQKVTKSSLERFVLMIAPLAPHIAEELWSRLGHQQSTWEAAWPTYDEAMLVKTAVTVVVQVKGKKRGTVEVAPDCSEDALKAEVVKSLSGTEFAVSEAAKFITVFQPGTKVPRLVNVL